MFVPQGIGIRDARRADFTECAATGLHPHEQAVWLAAGGINHPLGQGHDDSLQSEHVGHAPDVLVLTHAANQAVAVRGQPVDGRLKVVDLERHVAQS